MLPLASDPAEFSITPKNGASCNYLFASGPVCRCRMMADRPDTEIVHPLSSTVEGHLPPLELNPPPSTSSFEFRFADTKEE